MIHFNSIAFCYNNLVGICGRWEGKGNVCFKELWLTEQEHVCPLSDTFSVGKTLVPGVKKELLIFMTLLEWKTSSSTAHETAGKKFGFQPQFHNLNYGCKSLVIIIHSLPVVARLPTSLQATPKIRIFLHSQGQYIQKRWTYVPCSSGLQPMVGLICFVLLLLL